MKNIIQQIKKDILVAKYKEDYPTVQKLQQKLDLEIEKNEI